MATSSTPAISITKTTCVITEALKLWDIHARKLARELGGKKSRSRSLAKIIDDFEREGKPIQHCWSYGNPGVWDGLKKINFDITPGRLKVVERVRKTLSDFEGVVDVGLGFAVVAIIMQQLGSNAHAPAPALQKPPKAKRVA